MKYPQEEVEVKFFKGIAELNLELDSNKTIFDSPFTIIIRIFVGNQAKLIL